MRRRPWGFLPPAEELLPPSVRVAELFGNTRKSFLPLARQYRAPVPKRVAHDRGPKNAFVLQRRTFLVSLLEVITPPGQVFAWHEVDDPKHSFLLLSG